TIKDQHLYQMPVLEMQQLRQKHENFQGSTGEETVLLKSPEENVYELKLELDARTSGSVYLFADEYNERGLTLSFDQTNDTITMDRSKAGISFGEAYGLTRTAQLKKQDTLTL